MERRPRHRLGQRRLQRRASGRRPIAAGRRRAGDSANPVWLPSYTVANVFATYETLIQGRKVRFQLNVKNLFDRSCYASSVNEFGLALGDARQISPSAGFEF